MVRKNHLLATILVGVMVLRPLDRIVRPGAAADQ